MDSKQVIARFEAERQALAVMDHPNVAKVFDAGMTETGQSYFVMEHVKGIFLTEHCDRERLGIKERLQLFIDVCEAVQHAHQKGIIHRDLKPSNVLVGIEGNRAVPKVIDFGVAKAMAVPLTEKTLYTEQGQIIGTPEYMSPEQAEMEYWAMNNPASIVQRNAAAIRESGLAVYLDCGDQDFLNLYEGAEFLHRILQEHRIPHEYHLVLGADHAGRSLKRRSMEGLQFLDRAISPQGPDQDPVLQQIHEAWRDAKTRAEQTAEDADQRKKS
jgi:hypothetical protein